MKLIINGKERVIDYDQVAITKALELFDVKSPDMVSVQLNRKFVNKEDYGSTLLKENDELDFLYFMGGGGFKEEVGSSGSSKQLAAAVPGRGQMINI